MKILNHIANLALSEALFRVITGRMKYTGRRGILGFLLEDISLFLVVLMGDRGDGNEGRIHTLMLQEIEKENTVEGWQVGLINSGQSLYVLFGRERESMEERCCSGCLPAARST